MTFAKFLISICVSFFLCCGSHAQYSGNARVDPNIVPEVLSTVSPINWQSGHGYTDAGGKTCRNTPINTGVANLVLIVAGQSLRAAIAPTAYTVTNSTAVDNHNIYDGCLYTYSDPPLGSAWAYLNLNAAGCLSCGSIGGRVADLFINAGTFARVIVVPVAVGGVTVAQWDATLYGRICVAMRQLAAKGITPATTNVTFAIDWGQGEADHGTSSASYKASLASMAAKVAACGFSGRSFISEETWSGGSVDATVQGAQTSIVDNVTFWAGANIDSLNATNRQADNTHLNDTGIAAAATLIKNAMHASGTPF